MMRIRLQNALSYAGKVDPDSITDPPAALGVAFSHPQQTIPWLNSVFPVIRGSMQVHNGKNQNDISILGIDNAIWKTTDLTSTYVVLEKSPSIWQTENILYCGVNFDGEIITKPDLATLIVVYGVEEFRLRFRMEGVLHLVDCLKALSNTISPGIGFTFPERSSWRRFFATSAHLASIPVSGIFRLRRSESAMSARSSTGSDRASSIIFLVVIAI